MEKKRKLVFCGGDRRLIYCAERFADAGDECLIWRGESGTEDKNVMRVRDLRQACENADAVIMSIPAFTGGGKLICTDDGRSCVDCEYIFEKLPASVDIFGGKFAAIVKRVAAEYNHSLTDYAVLEEFGILNAIPTAEAAVEIAMSRLKKTLWDSSVTVLGYGRIGRTLTKRLLALGANVTVAARSAAALAAAESDGAAVCGLSHWLRAPERFDVCYNTVPCQIVGEECVAACAEGIFIDLASAPGGFTDEARSLLGDRLIIALSLPGKYSPETAGTIIYKTVNGLLRSGKRGGAQ